MRAVAQRVSQASATVDGRTVGSIGPGLLVYVGVARDDAPADAAALAEKVAGLRVFDDGNGVMNLSVEQSRGSILAVSAFTTQGDVRRGRRPSYELAATPEKAEPLYDDFCAKLSELGLPVERGRFRAEMKVASVNDGPVCILLDTRKAF